MKYINLYNFLISAKTQEITCTFGELEALLGFQLPASAHKYPAWWSNTGEGHTHSAAWLNAGWKTRQVKLADQTVRFVRQRQFVAPVDAHVPEVNGFSEAKQEFEMDAETKTDLEKPSLFGAMSGSLTVMTGVDLTEPTQADFEVSEGGL